MTTLEQLNRNAVHDVPAFVSALHGIYEDAPWIPERAARLAPFANLTALKQALQSSVMEATEAEQLRLILAHPELSGNAVVAGQLTPASRAEQAQAALDLCEPEELATLQQRNRDYRTKFGFPFILAVRGPTGKGLTRQQIIAALTRRLRNHRADEWEETLRQIGRIAELRLNDLLGHTPVLGDTILHWAECIGAWSEDDGALTCTYMTDVHRRTASQIAHWMREAGMLVHIDAVGNVVGRYLSTTPQAKTLMTGSHYDTVRNGGKYDGRAGLLLAIAVIRQLHERGETLPFHVEVVGFSEEEGVRFKSAFLGSNALVGQFDLDLLNLNDRNGVCMRDALTQSGHDVATIPQIARVPSDLLGYIEVHIEQGPVLLQRNHPVGIVSSIAGSSRYLVELKGLAGHAGTTPMHLRKDAAAAAAEIILYVEQRCAQDQHAALVGTVGQLHVPDGATNVIPGVCRLSLDIRAARDDLRQAAVADILYRIDEVCQRRNIDRTLEETTSVDAVSCSPRLMQQLTAATERVGVQPFTLASGAGHDAMTIAKLTEVAMLFTRCGNGGISHHPLETMTADDAEVSAQIFLEFLRNFMPKRSQHDHDAQGRPL